MKKGTTLEKPKRGKEEVYRELFRDWTNACDISKKFGYTLDGIHNRKSPVVSKQIEEFKSEGYLSPEKKVLRTYKNGRARRRPCHRANLKRFFNYFESEYKNKFIQSAPNIVDPHFLNSKDPTKADKKLIKELINLEESRIQIERKRSVKFTKEEKELIELIFENQDRRNRVTDPKVEDVLEAIMDVLLGIASEYYMAALGMSKKNIRSTRDKEVSDLPLQRSEVVRYEVMDSMSKRIILAYLPKDLAQYLYAELNQVQGALTEKDKKSIENHFIRRYNISKS